MRSGAMCRSRRTGVHLEAFAFRQNRNSAPGSCFGAFSQREPASTSLENALARVSEEILADSHLIETAQERDESRFLDETGSLVKRAPAGISLIFFAPALKLLVHSEQVHVDFTNIEMGVATFEVAVASDWLFTRTANQSRLFERFAGRRVTALAAFHWPTFGNNPAPCFARRQQQHMDDAVAIKLQRQGCHLGEIGKFLIRFNHLHMPSLGFGERESQLRSQAAQAQPKLNFLLGIDRKPAVRIHSALIFSRQ
jgi:hypothetical protein